MEGKPILRNIKRLDWSNKALELASFAPQAGLLLTLVLVTVVYSPTLGEPFHGDDFVAFTDFKTKDFWRFSTDVFLFKDSNFYWRPLGDIFHYGLYSAFGLNPWVFRLAALLVFLATLVCIYAFCRREQLGGWTAVGAALVFGVMPSHVVSVTWVTNTSRLAAGLFLLLCLLSLQATRNSRQKLLWECLAFIAFVLAVLNDEVTAALVLVPLVYATFIVRSDFKPVPAIVRLTFYGAFVAVIVPLQFMNTIDNEARLTEYGFGPHMPESFWVAASQLSLPVAAGGPLDVYLHRFGSAEWAAGLVTLVTLVLLTITGSRTTRFVALWCLVAILPFSLWKPLNISPRYVYLAAIPFSILVSWAVVSLGTAIRGLTARPGLPLAAVRLAITAVALPLAVIAMTVSVRAVQERDRAWGVETGRYGVLRDALEEWPAPAKGTRIVIYYGEWADFWATATARSLYGDTSLQVVSIPRQRVETPFASQPSDEVFYLIGDRLMPTVARR